MLLNISLHTLVNVTTLLLIFSVHKTACKHHFKHVRGTEACSQSKIVEDVRVGKWRDNLLTKLCTWYTIGITNIRHLCHVLYLHLSLNLGSYECWLS